MMLAEHGTTYRQIYTGNNASKKTVQIFDELDSEGFNKGDHDVEIDYNNPLFQELSKDYDVFPFWRGMDHEHIWCKNKMQVNPCTIVYNTSFPKEVNRMLITSFFDTLKEVESWEEEQWENYSYFEDKVFSFIHDNASDLIECFGSKQELIQFLHDYNFDFEHSEDLDQLEEYVQQYSSKEIVDGINSRQSEIEEVMAETVKETANPELDLKNKRLEDDDSNPGGDKR